MPHLRRTFHAGTTVGAALLVLLSMLFAAMSQTSPSPTPRPDINAVLAAHDQDLLAIPGVVGVYVGLLEDGKTPCLKVMLTARKPAAEQPIPAAIEGYPVVSEVTGELRPLPEERPTPSP